jgi:hypothetical protein
MRPGGACLDRGGGTVPQQQPRKRVAIKVRLRRRASQSLRREISSPLPGDRWYPLRFTSIADIASDVIALNFETTALRSVRSRRSGAEFPIDKKFARATGANLPPNTSCCFAYYVQCS